jgi:hypothetical protein
MSVSVSLDYKKRWSMRGFFGNHGLCQRIRTKRRKEKISKIEISDWALSMEKTL